MTGAFAHRLPETPADLPTLARRAVEAARTLNLYEGDDAMWDRFNARAIEARDEFRAAFKAQTGIGPSTMGDLIREGIF